MLVGFVLGPVVGIPPWAVALLADIVLVAITRVVPWRSIPLVTAAGVAGVAGLRMARIGVLAKRAVRPLAPA